MKKVGLFFLVLFMAGCASLSTSQKKMEMVGVYEWRFFDIGLNLYLHSDGEFEELKFNPFGMLDEAATFNRKGKWILKRDTLTLFPEGSPDGVYQVLRTTDSLILQKEMPGDRLKRYYKNSNKSVEAMATRASGLVTTASPHRSREKINQPY